MNYFKASTKKKLIVNMLLLMTLCSSALFAEGIGVKGGYAFMRNDFAEAHYSDNWTAGIFFDLGSFLFKKLHFMPSFDYVRLERDDDTATQQNEYSRVDLYGFHLDWYWFFFQQQTITPFLGFGFALNYKSLDDRTNENDDSDSGVVLFLGAEYRVLDDINLIFEIRYAFTDISNREENILRTNAGVLFHL